MYRKGALLAAALLLLIQPQLVVGQAGDPAARIRLVYQKGDHLFHLTNNTATTDAAALTDFERVSAALQKIADFPGKDTLRFQAYLKQGILLDSRADYMGAKSAYCKALFNHPKKDSLAFVANVYLGTIYYNLNDFDSARYFLLAAESEGSRYKDQEDEVRLYNTLGVLYFDNGNYEQGKNYFSRALGIVGGKQPFDTISAVNLRTNIATSYYHLGLFRESLEMYHKILSYHLSDDLINMNMGMAYSSLEHYREALGCFKKVHVREVPGVLNEMGYALLQLHRPDSSARCLDALQSLGASLKLNALDLGTNDFYRADLLAGKGDYLAAIKSVQKAITLFSPNFSRGDRNFSREDIYSNPGSFTGAFASYRLFDALFKKAVLFDSLYRLQPREQFLVAADSAFQATLAILRYIEKSYDTDDAKLFLKKKNGIVYQGALSICLELYRLHPKGDYLERAFLISEKSKASVITANLEERNLNKVAGTEGGWLQKEQNIKYNIARLDVRLEETSGKSEMEKISEEKAGYEIELSRLQKQLEKNGNYYRLKYEDSTPGVRELQAHLGRKQALISCYLTADALHLFILTSSHFAYSRIDSVSLLQRDADDWMTLLKSTENGRRWRGDAIGDRLSRMLVKPILDIIPDQEEWIVVPDGFLYFLPFESLPYGKGTGPLLETTTISYEFASRMILPGGGAGGPDAGGVGGPDTGGVRVLAFAPFAGHGGGATGQGGATDQGEAFARLPASLEEIGGLQGRQYIDSQATKAAFLKELNHYPIVHLATHAVSSLRSPAGSFVAFYPGRGGGISTGGGTGEKGSLIDNRLFLEELYGLDMNRTKLVVISACETGQGEVISNEGVISLARAFSYAGCASTISSLWKADDQATSFILQRFYVHLKEGETKSRALRQAKLDYLASGTVNKSPAYWSHLVLMGDGGAVYNAGHPYWWGILVFLLGLLLFALWRFVLRKKLGKKKKSAI